MSVQSGGQQQKRLLLPMLNDQLTCHLCGGYYIDATTIIECLHSFCRSCIVKYLEKSKYCPICEVQVHKSKPLLNIRSDPTLQNIVYKLVPGCYQNEMRCRKEFYEKHPEDKNAVASTSETSDSPHIFSPDESLNLSLEYYMPQNAGSESQPVVDSNIGDGSNNNSGEGAALPRRYLRCPAAVTVFHLQKLIRAKYGLTQTHRVDILYQEEPLCSTYTLMDIMYIYLWKRKVPLHLSYRIFESSPKRPRLSEESAEFKQSLSDAGIGQSLESPQDSTSKREWKEVQLKISETGVMSVMDISSPEKKEKEPEQCEKQVICAESGSKKSTFAATSITPRKESTQKSSDVTENVTEPYATRSSVKFENLATEKSKVEEQENKKKAVVRTSKTVASKDSTEAEKVKEETESKGGKNSALTNNNSISSGNVSSTPKQNAKTSMSVGAGSKINALSAKLQFQPKLGQVNNTYSKKGAKEKKNAVTLTAKSVQAKSTKKSETTTQQPQESTTPKSRISPKTVPDAVKVTSVSSSNNKTTTAAPTVISDSTVDTLFALQTFETVLASVKSSPMNHRLLSTLEKDPKVEKNVITADKTQASKKQTAATKPEEDVKTESLESKTSTFPYTVKDLVENANSSIKLSESLLYSKVSNASCESRSTTTFVPPRINIQTPSMSIYSVPSVATSKQNTGTTHDTPIMIPPCPGAIPLSMMKSTLRKNHMQAKGTGADSCKISPPPGSKIDDICAKIGENSKEKIKLETAKIRPDIPGLLEISKKSEGMKQFANIHVPIFKPSIDNKANYDKDKKRLMSLSSTTISAPIMSPAVVPQLSLGQKMVANKKRASPAIYKTLRNPPRSWNPTLSKNNYVAAKNQAKELEQQGHVSPYPCDNNPVPKHISSKPSKIFTMRNVPRYLGNPASGVKPMYGMITPPSEAKDGKDQQTKLDYPPFSRGNASNSPVSPRNSPVNMQLSTNPFIPSPTPNTNPRLIYSTFPQPQPPPASSSSSFVNPGRFSHPLIPSHSPMAMPPPPPLSAFHSSLPQVKFYQRPSSYGPQSSPYPAQLNHQPQQQQQQPPTIQRIPPSTGHSSTPKVVNTTTAGGAEGREAHKPKVSLNRKDAVFNLSSRSNSLVDLSQQAKLDLYAKLVTSGAGISPKVSVTTTLAKEKGKSEEPVEIETSPQVEESKKVVVLQVPENVCKKEEEKEEKKESRINGQVTTTGNSETKQEEKKDERVEKCGTSDGGKSCGGKKDQANGVVAENPEKGEEKDEKTSVQWKKSVEQVQGKKLEPPRSEAES